MTMIWYQGHEVDESEYKLPVKFSR